MADDEVVGEPEADVMEVGADIGSSYFEADVVAGAGLEGA